MSTREGFELSVDDVPDTIALDVAGKQEALDIARSLDVNRARLVLRKVEESLKISQEISRKYEMRRRQEKEEEEQSVLPRGRTRFLRSAVSNHQFWYGPLGGHLGKAIIAALYLNDHRDRLSAWLDNRDVDSTRCLMWVDERLELLRTMQSVNGSCAGVEKNCTRAAHRVIFGSTRRGSKSTRFLHSAYGEEGSRMLAGLFLLDSQDDFMQWLEERGFVFERPLAWAERQANEFRWLIGPDVKIPACQYPEMT